MKKTLLSTILALAFATVLPAQFENGERPEPNFDDVIAHLALTEAQLTCLESNQESFREAVQPLAEEARGVQREIRQTTRDGGDVTALQTQLEGIRSQIEAALSSHVVSAQACLDASQASALAELVAAETLRSEVAQGTRLLLIEPTEERAAGAQQAGPRRRAPRRGGQRGGAPDGGAE